MNRKKSLAAVLLLCTVFGFTACGTKEQTKNGVTTKKVDKQAATDISNVHLRDKKSLYDKDHTKVTTMYLTVRRGDATENQNHSWSEVNQYSVEDYQKMGVKRYQVAGLLQVGNEDGPVSGELGYDQDVPNASVQIRGESSSKNAQKNYKIKIKKNKGEWNGQRTINLNKHQTEALRFRNKLSYDLMEEIPQLMGARTSFVHLYVKDETSDNPSGKFEDYGLYTQVEQINKNYLKDHGLDENANLYKPNFFEFFRYEDTIVKEEDPKFDKDKFEKLLEIKGSHDHTKLIDFLTKLNDPSVKVETIMDKYVDPENIQYWMAFQMLLGNDDTQSRNMYLYSPQNSTKWYIIPWDNDSILMKNERRLVSKDSDQANSWEVGVSNYWGDQLFQRLLKSKEFRKGLDEKMDELRKTITGDKITSMSNEYAAVIRPYLAKMPDQMHAKTTPDNYDKILADLPNELENNYKIYKTSLEKPQPFFINKPEVANNKLKLSWGASYDFNNSKLTYTVELAKDYEFKDKVFEKSGLKTLSAETDTLPKGQYFVRVTATNEAGQSQRAFDYYVNSDNSKQFGIMSFFVLEDGKIGVDGYED